MAWNPFFILRPPGSGLRPVASVCLAIACAVVHAGTVVAVDRGIGAVGFSRLDTLVVVVDRQEEIFVPATGSVLTVVELDSEKSARDLADVLARTAGLQIRRYGAAGSSAVPSLRGSSPSQVKIFIDGMPLDDAQTGLIDLARLPLERFATVEIHRGAVPVGLGGSGGIGAINLKTRTGSGGWDLTAAAGSFGELRGRALWSAGDPAERGSILVLAHGMRADNDFTYIDDNRTLHRSDDDFEAVRVNSWVEEYGGLVKGDWAVSRDVRFEAWGGYLRRDGGRPGPLGYPSPHASVRYDRLDGFGAVDWKQGLVRAEVSGARTGEYLYDPYGEIPLSPPGENRSQSEDLTGRLTLGPRLVESSGFDLDLRLAWEQRSQWYQQWYNAAEEPSRNRNQTTLLGSMVAGFFANRVRVQPGVRWQRNVDDFPPVTFPWLPEESGVRNEQSDLSPSVGVTWEAAPARLFFEGHAARTVRAPTWVELFGHRGGIQGNRALVPEEIESFDLAAVYRAPAGAWTGRVSVFQAETDSTIIFVANSQATSQARNVGRTRTRGIELELGLVLPANFFFEGNATFQQALDTGGIAPYDGKELPNLPGREAFLRLRLDGHALSPWTELVLMSSNYRDRQNSELIAAQGRTEWNLGASYSFGHKPSRPDPRWTVSIAVLNLTNSRIQDIEGYPLPGRSWRLSGHVRP